MHWIKTTHIGTQVDGSGDTTVLVNLNHIKLVAPVPQKAYDTRGKSKLTFEDGQTMVISASIDMIEAEITNSIERGYVAPDPKEG